MSTYLKTADLDASILTYKIVEDSRLAEVAIVDVTQGSGTLRSIEVDASNANAHQYLKLKFTTTDVTVGTTVPDMIIFCASQKRFTQAMPSGLSFDGLSAWLVSSQADTSDANTEAAAGRFTTVRFITT
tara:strand:+ start:85 stop:471 length:387 start_codon:yes stop_codon:yes gene_type:complete